jgi:hypothetical protein
MGESREPAEARCFALLHSPALFYLREKKKPFRAVCGNYREVLLLVTSPAHETRWPRMTKIARSIRSAGINDCSAMPLPYSNSHECRNLLSKGYTPFSAKDILKIYY